jgi:cysteine synthase
VQFANDVPPPWAALGFRAVIVIPETQSREKKDTLRLLGANVVGVTAVPSARLARRCVLGEPVR